MERKRILIVTRNFPPLVGGMERLMLNVFDKLGQDYVCDIIGPKGCSKYINPPHRAIECDIKPLFFFLVKAFLKAIIRSSTTRYDLCFAGSGVTAPITVFISKVFSIPSISYIHGLDLVAQNFVYQRFFVPLIRKVTTVVVNSNNTAKLARSKGVSAEDIAVLFPGVDIPEIITETCVGFLKKYALEEKKILLSVGRLVPRKGVVKFIQDALPQILSCCPDTTYVIIGSEPEDALKKESSVLLQINSTVKEMGFENNVLILGRVDDSTLRSAYQCADMLVFPLVNTPGDVEGFGMVAVEAAANGLPTIGFSVGGLPDAVNHGVSGILIDPGNYDTMGDDIIRYLQDDKDRISKSDCIIHAEKFSWNHFGKELINICVDTMDKYKQRG